ncbi:hypothetical protein [Streptomyces luteireticuli]|uniref:hypothetical protein n=1 Tax=Streptomyces luteireticuli TaxID=173858 RepID=UPI0035574751
MLKYKTEKRPVTREVTLDGKTHTTTRMEPVRVPRLPRDWQAVTIRGLVVLVLALTLFTVVWSTISIGDLLGGGIVGLAVASIFDLAWLVNIGLERLAMFDRKKRRFPQVLGWGLLVVTMGSLFWHGMTRDDVPLAVVGAIVSLIAKILWMGIMRHIHVDLNPDHADWVEQETSAANATRALARVRRQAAQAEAEAALEILAAEQLRGEFEALTPARPAVEPDVLEADVLEDVVDDGPGRDELTLARAVRAILQDAAAGAGVSEEADEAIDAARADGWTVREVYDAATRARRRRDAVSSRVHAVTARPETGGFDADFERIIRPEKNGYPRRPVSAQVSDADAARRIRPDIRPTTDPGPDEPEPDPAPQRRPAASLAATVKELVADGLTDADYIARALADRFQRTTADPKYRATVARYVREAKQEGAEHPGQYL